MSENDGLRAGQVGRIGYVGLGIMGRPMAGHLQAAGHELFLRDINPLPRELLDKGASACGLSLRGHVDEQGNWRRRRRVTEQGVPGGPGNE